MRRSVWRLLAVMSLPLSAGAQDIIDVSGTVMDENGEPLIGATVRVVGENIGASTDIDGAFSLKAPSSAKEIEVSYVGYAKKLLPITREMRVVMQQDQQLLNEVVVIGYGVRKKDDMTGAVSTISEKDFNKGVISSPEELINGKIAGVQITSGGGSPNGGSTIRVRGGASLNASNDPLVVLDGVPMEVGGWVEGSGNFLSLINPNDIESMTILKDASSTAIYGSRASNGVIIITTKKGSGNGIKVSFQSTNSISHKTETAGHLDVDEFRWAVNNFGSEEQKNLLGQARTDWNNEIYRVAFGSDNNLSVGGRLASWLPFRVSLGVNHQEGILKTDASNRYTANINLTPSFLQDRLKVNLSGKGTLAENRIGNTGAIWNAFAYDPTQPVYGTSGPDGSQLLFTDGSPLFGGYHEVVDNAGFPAQGAISNPLSMIELNDESTRVWRFVGNADVDYRFRYIEGLRLHVTGGHDYSRGSRSVHTPMNSFIGYKQGGSNYKKGPNHNYNTLLTAYANYNRDFDSLKSQLDVTLGYDYQYWKYDYAGFNYYNEAGEVTSVSAPDDQRHSLISYYGRVNYTFDSRYLLTATFRRDGSSRFSENNRWGTFPSVALAWRVSQESFWEPLSKIANDLKLRASYGVTGQQDGISNYAYIPNYTISQSGAYYLVDGTWIPTYRPQAYNSNLKWETSTTWNFGVDFAFLNNRFTATVDYYTRKTKDLLASVPIPAGTNFDKSMLTNVGNVDSKGVEIALNANLLSTQDITWTATFNATWQNNKITNLSLVPGTDVADTYVGYMESTGVQVFKTGMAPRTYKVYKQIYDEATGRPIEGLYADLNGDGIINEDDKYYYHNPQPDWILGLSTSFSWKKWTVSTSLRAQLNNYVYNGNASGMGAWECTSWNAGQINNLSDDFLNTQFRKRHYESDYYVENGSFLKMDNLRVSYDFGEVYKGLGLNLTAMVQNVFTLTKYKGLDPETAWGIENNTYPRPRTYSLTLGLNF